MKVESEYPFLLSLYWDHGLTDSCGRCLKEIDKEDAILYSIETGDCFCLECGLKIITEQKNYINSFVTLIESLNKTLSKKENVNE